MMNSNLLEPDITAEAEQGEQRLQQFFLDHPRLGLAFSGGVDSAYLLWAAARWAQTVQPYYLAGPFQPRWEQERARQLARQLGCELRRLEVDVLQQADIRANDGLRCYYCKRLMLGQLLRQARLDSLPLLADGNNATDDSSQRPGMRAGAELGVCSPLRLCGLGKPHIRLLSRRAALPTWDQPAYSCLATRIVSGRQLCHDDLQRIAAGEGVLLELGLSDFRLRLTQMSGTAASLQVRAAQLELVRRLQPQIERRLAAWFSCVNIVERT